MNEGEFDLIKRLFYQAGGKATPFTRLAIGDDASIHRPKAGLELVVSTDSSVQGIHWPDDFPLEKAAHRAICSALSDLAAMGATPACAWLNVMATNQQSVEDMGKGATAALQCYDVELAGGDTCRSACNALSVTVAGQLPNQQAMRRNAAYCGDAVWLCGRVGFHALGLQQWFHGQKEGVFIPCFESIVPLLDIGVQLRQAGVACCIDVSDGLLQDAGHICSASNIGMEIDIECVPEWDYLCQQVGEEEALQSVAAGGEDYALLFTASPDIVLPQGLNAMRIGQCVQGSRTVRLLLNAVERCMEVGGFDHFNA